MPTILAAKRWKNNGYLIADVAELGYLDRNWLTLDATYGLGTWWKQWSPATLITNDLDALTDATYHFDFTAFPSAWEETFDAVAYDPPYKLNGTPTPGVDDRYGVGTASSWQTRHGLIRGGLAGCWKVLKPGGILLMKCQDQVCSGAIRWQTDEFTTLAVERGMSKIDEFQMLGGRPQPEGRRQVHAQMRPSTLLVLKKAA